VCEVLVSDGVGNIPASLGGAMRMYLAYVCIRCISRRCSHMSSPPSLGPVKAIEGCSSSCFYAPSLFLRETEG
jgi:hypothetical protein